MFNEKQAFATMGGAVILYSLFPLFNALSVGAVPPLVYVFKACVVAVAIDALVLRGYRTLSSNPGRLSFRNVKFFFLAAAALVATIAYCVLVFAFSIGSNAGVTMLYELWPMVVFFAFPIIFRKRFLRIGWMEGSAAIVAIIGLGLIVLSGKAAHDVSLGEMLRSGEALGLVAGGLMAIAVLLKSASIVGEDLEELTFGEFALVDLVNRAMASGFALLAIIIFAPHQAAQILQWDSSIGFGVIEGLGGLLYWVAVGRSNRSSIQLLLYLAPVLGFVWLFMAGLSELTGAVLFGSMLIFAANVVAHFKGEQTVAFFLTVLSAIVFGAISYLTTPANGGFLLLGTFMTLYAILIGFLLSRLADRNLLQRQLCLEAMRTIPDHCPDHLKIGILKFLRDSFRLGPKQLSIRYKELMELATLQRAMKDQLTSIVLLRINPISAGEMLATVAIGTMVVVAAFTGRPEGYLGDMSAFTISIVVVYLSVSIIEQKDVRVGEGRIMMAHSNLHDHSDDRAIDFIVSGLALVVGIVILVAIAMALKHGALVTQ